LVFFEHPKILSGRVEKRKHEPVLGLCIHRRCSRDKKETRLVGTDLFVAPSLSLPAKQNSSGSEERKTIWQGREMEIWRLPRTSDQTPSETLREIYFKVVCVNCGSFPCEEK
jgi:hypothetical protein